MLRPRGPVNGLLVAGETAIGGTERVERLSLLFAHSGPGKGAPQPALLTVSAMAGACVRHGYQRWRLSDLGLAAGVFIMHGSPTVYGQRPITCTALSSLYPFRCRGWRACFLPAKLPFINNLGRSLSDCSVAIAWVAHSVKVVSR